MEPMEEVAVKLVVVEVVVVVNLQTQLLSRPNHLRIPLPMIVPLIQINLSHYI